MAAKNIYMNRRSLEPRRRGRGPARRDTTRRRLGDRDGSARAIARRAWRGSRGEGEKIAEQIANRDFLLLTHERDTYFFFPPSL